MIILIKELPTSQIKLVKEKEMLFNPKQKLFLDTLTTFLTAQTTLSESDVTDLIEQSRKIGAPDFAELLNVLIQNPEADIARIPLKVPEKFFSAQELAEICGVSVQLIRRECEKGHIKATKGKKNSWKIAEGELQNPLCQRWLEDKQTMWSKIEQAKDVLKDNNELLENLKNIEENRKK
ncbi:helix-turn-helix domain-containing protein [Bacillus cereus]|uniref:helix-turn-helix domain-containing protein n=1 Tax=Bacillus cereus group TaxID=86661 RepID=UPI0002FB14FD|nr:helix-turn-helix domain-containing protein [Bacillus cereus]KMP66033.1 hypothetical protein TU56_11700 [Bacillus cereus]MCC2509816.1 helix-turn-helix domain-containing protein [Bacillus cereus]MDZ4474497.1 helix-turn-helix domain-containing protein [Bacillus cereus]MEB9882015.1 helix-turn-helix domain-containing protein [Bacillus cereus]HDR4451154.1 helix-turn-helix domain-containing protein [Bacillus cereus]